MRAILLLIVGLGCSWVVYGQQTPLFSQYYINPYLLNPAFAGSDVHARAFLSYRKQWTGIPGSPETQAFSIDGTLNNENMGLGIVLFNDVTNILGRINLMGSYSYRIQLSEAQHLTMGASLGVLQHRIYFDRIRSNSPEEPGLLNAVDNKTVMDGNVGIKYTYDRWLFGVAITQLFQNKIEYENTTDFRVLDFRLIRHYTATLQYDVDLGNTFTLTPMALIRVAQGLSPQIDFSAILCYRDQAWAGVSYRTQIGTNFSMGFTIDEKFVFGYAYEIPTRQIRELGKGSHEFTVGLRLNSLFSGKGKSQPTAALSRERNTMSQPSYTPSREDIQLEKYDALEQRNEQLEEQIERQQRELELIRSMMLEHREELQQLVEKSSVDVSKKENFDQSHQYYLVIGATRDLQEAKLFQQMIKRETGTNSKVIQNDKKSWYLIYTGTLQSPGEARKKIKTLKEDTIHEYIVGNPWVYRSEK